MSSEKENTGAWLLVYLMSLISSIAFSLLLIGVGYEHLAKIIFLWLPIIAIVVVKFVERPVLRGYFESGDHGQRIIRKDAPKSVVILLKLIPTMAFMMIGYAFAHLTKHGSI